MSEEKPNNTHELIKAANGSFKELCKTLQSEQNKLQELEVRRLKLAGEMEELRLQLDEENKAFRATMSQAIALHRDSERPGTSRRLPISAERKTSALLKAHFTQKKQLPDSASLSSKSALAAKSESDASASNVEYSSENQSPVKATPLSDDSQEDPTDNETDKETNRMYAGGITVSEQTDNVNATSTTTNNSEEEANESVTTEASTEANATEVSDETDEFDQEALKSEIPEEDEEFY